MLLWILLGIGVIVLIGLVLYWLQWEAPEDKVELPVPRVARRKKQGEDLYKDLMDKFH